MKLSLLACVRLWLAQRHNRWCRPREGWLRWVLWGRRVEPFWDPRCEGSVNNAGPAPEWQPTVKARVL